MYSHQNIILDGRSIPSDNIALSDDDTILSLDSELENDSNQSNSNEMSSKPKTEFMVDLKSWITNHNISHTAVCDLLNILSKHDHQNFGNLSNLTRTNTTSLKREASSPIMDNSLRFAKISNISNTGPNTNDISARLDTVEQKIDIHQIATQQVLANQSAMQEMLKIILQRLPGDPKTAMSDLDISYADVLPITSVEMLEEYESKLRNLPEFKNQMINILSQFGGPDAKKTSRNIVRAMITDEVLINFSWTGTNTKRVFSNFREINLTIIATMRKKFHDYTEYDNATFFKEYLKHASTRLYRHDFSKINNVINLI